MFIKFSSFKNAIDMAVKFSDADPVGFLMVQKNGRTAIVSASSKQGIFTEIEVESTDEEKALGDIVFDYKMIADVLGKITPSGNIKIGVKVDGALKHDTIILDLSNIASNIVKFVGDKYYETQIGENVFNKISAHLEIDSKAFISNDKLDNKYKVLARFDYDTNIFTYDAHDTWEKEDLVNILKKLSKGDDTKACYIIRKNKNGYVVNRSSVFKVDTPEYVSEASFTMLCKTAKNMIDVLNKVNTSDIDVFNNDDKSFCSFVAPDKTFGLWYGMVPFRPQDAKTLATYTLEADGATPLDYSDISLLINKESLIDTIKSYKMNFKKENTVLAIKFNDADANESMIKVDSDDDGNTSEELVRIEGGTAIEIGDKKGEKAKYYVAAARCKEGTPAEVKMVMVFSTWESILNVCEESNIRFDIRFVDDKSMYVRACELSSTEVGDDGKSPKVLSEMYFVVTNTVEA